jgi:hypothetical protein
MDLILFGASVKHLTLLFHVYWIIRFKGSSFKAIGNQNKDQGEWAIVGGTGVFTFARGTISIYRIQGDWFSNIKEIRISAFCPKIVQRYYWEKGIYTMSAYIESKEIGSQTSIKFESVHLPQNRAAVLLRKGDIHCVWIHSKNNVFRKVKTSYNLEWMEYISLRERQLISYHVKRSIYINLEVSDLFLFHAAHFKES